jgi:tetraacyldisaccharide 4'-kinase
MPSQSSSIESTLMRAWMRRGGLACALWPLSLIFRMLVALRRCLYQWGWLQSTRVRVPVIVVGNVFVGGTGKTPLVIWLAQALRKAGHAPGVISRGYGVQSDVPCGARADSSPKAVGDEPVLIARHAGCPVMVSRSRVAAANTLLVAHPEVTVLIADDGLQHYALQRDIEIVLFDGRGKGNGWMLPAGPLREPAGRRGDFTVVNGATVPADMPRDVVHMQLVGELAENMTDRSQTMALSNIKAGKVVAAAGIGNPSRFFAMLRDAGVEFDALPLPDHYDFATNPFSNLQADIILITEKDAVKCRQLEYIKHDARLWVVPVEAHIDNVFAEQILERLRECTTA